MQPKVGIPASYTLLTPSVSGHGDPGEGILPVKTRTGFVMQQIMLQNNIPITAKMSASTARASGTITVVATTFDGEDEIFIGDYVFQEGLHYTGVVGDTDATAAALATAINNTGAFSAAAVASVITVEGPTGLQGLQTVFSIIKRSSVVNFSLSPTTGLMAGAEPSISAVTVIG